MCLRMCIACMHAWTYYTCIHTYILIIWESLCASTSSQICRRSTDTCMQTLCFMHVNMLHYFRWPCMMPSSIGGIEHVCTTRPWFTLVRCMPFLAMIKWPHIIITLPTLSNPDMHEPFVTHEYVSMLRAMQERTHISKQADSLVLHVRG